MSSPVVAVFGEAIIDLIQNENLSFEMHVGGSPFNVAREMARLGLNCHYLSPISTDQMGKKIIKLANSEGIEIPAALSSDKPTSIALVYTDETGAPDYTLYREFVADLDINSTRLLAALPKSLVLFHTGSLALVPKLRSELKKVFNHLKRVGVRISIDVNFRKCTFEEDGIYRDVLRELITYADYLKVSDEDLEGLGVEGDFLDFCRQLTMNTGISLIAFTQGAKGASLITKSHTIHRAAILPSLIGDTVGAGDTFFAAMLSYLTQNGMLVRDVSTFSKEELEKTLNFSSVAASLTVSRIGCNPPYFDEVVEKASEFELEI